MLDSDHATPSHRRGDTPRAVILTLRTLPIVLACLVSLTSDLTFATPGPDSTAILYNSQHGPSVKLTEQYGTARSIPPTQRCAISVPPFVDIEVAAFRESIVEPLLACLSQHQAFARIEAIAVVHGVPRRVRIDAKTTVSLNAALAIAQSTVTSNGSAILGKPPGKQGSCGGQPCLAATWPNPYQAGPFHAGYVEELGAVTHRMWLVTSLDGFTPAHVEQLIERSGLAETQLVQGQWLLMKAADTPRASLDKEYPHVAEKLAGLVTSDVDVIDFDAKLSGKTIMALVTGTKSLPDAFIDDNVWLPGAVVDNLTSLGAVPQNFDPKGPHMQVSVARFVAAGATGVHGTVAEPLSNSFPSRQFLVDYAGGSTLAEAFFGNMPFVYWMNYVIGDPMAAPFAKRPRVQVDLDGSPVDHMSTQFVAEGDHTLSIRAVGDGDKIERIRLLTNGKMELDVVGSEANTTLTIEADQDLELVAVAQVSAAATGAGVWQSKGWRTVVLTTRDREATGLNAGVGGQSSNSTASASQGGGCAVGPQTTGSSWPVALLCFIGLALLGRRRQAPVR